MEIRCPKCGQAFPADARLIGRKARCGACMTVFRIAHPGPPAVPAIDAKAAPDSDSADAFVLQDNDDEYTLAQPVAPPRALPSEPVPCPGCGARLAPQVIICSRCGMNVRTGAPSTNRWDDEESETPSAGIRVLQFFAEWLPGLFRGKIVFLFFLLTAVALVCAWMCVFFIALGAVLIAVPTGAIVLIVYGQAVALVLVGETMMLHEALAELNGTRWALFFTLLFGPMAAAYFIIRHLVAMRM